MAEPTPKPQPPVPKRAIPSDPDMLLVGVADADAIERLLNEKAPERWRRSQAPGDAIVVFERPADEKIRKVVDGVRKRFIELYGYRPRLSPRHRMLSGQPNVVGNPTGPPETADPPAWAGRLRSGNNGDGVVVAIIDTWINHNHWIAGGYAADPDAIAEVFTVGDGEEKRFVGVQPAHAVFLAGLVLQQAPGATVRVIRTADHDGQSEIDDVARAIGAAVAYGADVINLSLGCYTQNNLPPWTLQDAVAAVPANVAIVASAGNEPGDRAFWPAALPRVTAVGALTGREFASYSNTGAWVQVYVDATGVVSTYVDDEGLVTVPLENGETRREHRSFPGWATWSGTSMAAAKWSGAIARVAGDFGLDGCAAERLLRTNPTAAGIERPFVPGNGSGRSPLAAQPGDVLPEGYLLPPPGAEAPQGQHAS
jgi:hypothetical protein